MKVFAAFTTHISPKAFFLFFIILSFSTELLSLLSLRLVIFHAVIRHVSRQFRKNKKRKRKRSHRCQLSGVNVWDGVNLKQDITGNEHMRSGDITKIRKGRKRRKGKSKPASIAFCNSNK